MINKITDKDAIFIDNLVNALNKLSLEKERMGMYQAELELELEKVKQDNAKLADHAKRLIQLMAKVHDTWMTGLDKITEEDN